MVAEQYDDFCRECSSGDSCQMLSGHSIIYFGPESWNGMWRNRHQLMLRFSQKNKVIYVEPLFSMYRLRKQLRRGASGVIEVWRDLWKARVTKVEDNLYIYHSPVCLPIFGKFPLKKISWGVWNIVFKKTVKSLGFTQPIIWLSRPNMAHFIGNFGEAITIYHVVDEYLAYGEMDVESRARLEAQERRLIKSVDLVIVVSENLFESKSISNKKTYLVPNGVDYNSYDKALVAETPLPPDIAGLPKPVIGYSGLISRRLDLDLIAFIAQTHPEWSLVLMGKVSEIGCENELNRLREITNVHFLGVKMINQVPLYVKEFDVCIIPYRLNEETRNLSPLKLYDFLAMGKEIVATGFPVAYEFKDVVHIADSSDMFVDSIEGALVQEDKDKELFMKRRQVAAQNTWEQRVKEISEIIMLHLGKTG